MRRADEIIPYAFSDGTVTSVEVRYEFVRCISMRTNGNTILVTAPWRTARPKICEFLRRHERWLKNRLTREPTGKTVRIFGKDYPVVVTQGKRNVLFGEDHVTVSLPDGSEEGAKRLLRTAYKKYAERYFLARAKEIYPIVAETVGLKTEPTFSVRYCKSYWGKCFYDKGEIRFNAYLLQASKEYIEYVVYHEYTHFSVHDHSEKFYKVLERWVPDCRKIRRERAKLVCSSWFDG